MLKQIENRRSIRKYLNKKVEKEKLVPILESARLAPSGSNTQPWTFIIIESEDTKEKLSIADHYQKWMLAACWTAWFEQDAVRPILSIPEDKYVCGIITLGYGDEAPEQRPRRAMEEIVRYEKW
ncbi:nitroreductase family protein [Anaerocolumna jejuensis]|uniref:nitroreductase family protein n=1 Tax=Anaerocolumna jejuensis TaxID=259063 RepID=UPI003F7C71C5